MSGRSALSFIRIDLVGFKHGRIEGASLSAKGLWLCIMSLAHETGDVVSVKADLRYLCRKTGCLPEELKPALDELLDLGSLTEVEGRFEIYGSDEMHEALLEKRAKNAERQQRFRDKAATKDKGNLPVQVEAADLPVKEEEAATPKPGSATERRAGVMAVCDEASDGSSEFYRMMLMESRKINVEAAEQGITMKDSFLLNAVLGHCARHTFEGRIPDRELASLNKLAGQIGYEAVVFALVESCTRDLTPGKEINYVMQVAKRKAAEVAKAAQ